MDLDVFWAYIPSCDEKQDPFLTLQTRCASNVVGEDVGLQVVALRAADTGRAEISRVAPK